MWLLVRLGHDTRIVKLKMSPFKGEGFLRPGAAHHFEGLGETLAAFAVRHAIVLVDPGEPAAADAEDQPALTDVVDRGGLFGQLKRVAER